MGPSGAAGSSRVVELTGPDGHGMRHQEAGGRKDYFPQCMPYMFGPLPLPPAPTPALASASAPRPLQPFPYNISFKHLNYALSSLPEDAEGWDVILLLSVLKWIHLNSSDAGLVQFFHKACAALRPGGVLVLELQDWEGYRKAARSNPTLKQHYKTLELRPERFAEVLLGEVGFRRVEHLGVAGEGGFRRSIDVYYKD
ncbi:Bin3-domain-containing protein [Calocera cornea HHB12733]|uniref:RNA methyltransferase n=1 Tax=Calocera cornea HHB12733 TaxID=1353952 RepID=A0A165IV42_9BASI|nr:Bin3-domain-containing protein [Calocera cornea HHB12733]